MGKFFQELQTVAKFLKVKTNNKAMVHLLLDLVDLKWVDLHNLMANLDLVLLLVLVDLKWADLDTLHNLMANLDLVLLLLDLVDLKWVDLHNLMVNLDLVLLLVLVDLKWVDQVVTQATKMFSFCFFVSYFLCFLFSLL